jgi:hypothetical protein
LQRGKRKGNRLSEASFSFPPSATEIQGDVAISGAPFFADFLWQDKESEPPPAGGETRDAPTTKKPRPTPTTKKLKP